MKKTVAKLCVAISIVIYMAVNLDIMHTQRIEIDHQQKEIDSLIFKYNCLEAQIYPELHND